MIASTSKLTLVRRVRVIGLCWAYISHIGVIRLFWGYRGIYRLYWGDRYEKPKSSMLQRMSFPFALSPKA